MTKKDVNDVFEMCTVTSHSQLSYMCGHNISRNSNSFQYMIIYPTGKIINAITTKIHLHLKKEIIKFGII